MEAVRNLASAATVLVSCVLVSVFVPQEYLQSDQLNNTIIDHNHPFVQNWRLKLDTEPIDLEDTIVQPPGGKSMTCFRIILQQMRMKVTRL